MAHYYWRPCNPGEPTTQECECPYCNLHIAGRIRYVIQDEDYPIYCVLECPVCQRPIIYQCNEHKTYPYVKPLKSVKRLPEQIATVYDEVNTAIGAGCYTAAVGLARTALNHIAVDNGAEENKSFSYYVKYLVDSGFVPPNAGAWVDKIRQLANDSVHHLEIRNHDEAVTIGMFLMYILIFVYELPASIN